MRLFYFILTLLLFPTSELISQNCLYGYDSLGKGNFLFSQTEVSRPRLALKHSTLDSVTPRLDSFFQTLVIDYYYFSTHDSLNCKIAEGYIEMHDLKHLDRHPSIAAFTSLDPAEFDLRFRYLSLFDAEGNCDQVFVISCLLDFSEDEMVKPDDFGSKVIFRENDIQRIPRR